MYKIKAGGLRWLKKGFHLGFQALEEEVDAALSTI